VYRAAYAAGLFVLMCTGWLVLAGTQVIRDVGDMARFGSILFQVLALLQLIVVVFFAAFAAAGAVAQEKDRRTLILLLMTRLSNCELVLGKLLAALLNVLVMAAAAVPVFAMIVLFGGVSFAQVGRVFAVTLAAALVGGSLGSTLALWREKTFQTLALTALTLVLWIGAWEAVYRVGQSEDVAGVSVATLAVGFHPFRAVLAAARPTPVGDPSLGWLGSSANLFLVFSIGLTALLNVMAIARVRVWNPSREVRRSGQNDQTPQETIWGVQHDLAESEAAAETARAGHVDARVKAADTAKAREVWDHPILWREVCTWAYGHRVIAIRLAYLLLFAAVSVALYFTIGEGAAEPREGMWAMIPSAAMPLVPFFVVSLVIVNALAVTSITNERDGLALDLLLVTDITPREFVFGKLLGVLWVTHLMVFLPMVLCVVLWWCGGLSGEGLIFVLGGLVVMNVFVAMLGIHCGMTYANSRSAIGVSLGIVFFLFLGVITCLLMMISFSGSFEGQLPAFLSFILGGGVGLYVLLGARNPSTAIGVASLVVPFATFYAITSFLLGGGSEHTLAVFLVTVGAYGFTTAALMIPAINEFDVEMGRTSGGEQEGESGDH